MGWPGRRFCKFKIICPQTCPEVDILLIGLELDVGDVQRLKRKLSMSATTIFNGFGQLLKALKNGPKEFCVSEAQNFLKNVKQLNYYRISYRKSSKIIKIGQKNGNRGNFYRKSYSNLTVWYFSENFGPPKRKTLLDRSSRLLRVGQNR